MKKLRLHSNVSIGSRRIITPRREHYRLYHIERENGYLHRVAKVIPEPQDCD